jgi:hypothetical protein
MYDVQWISPSGSPIAKTPSYTARQPSGLRQVQGTFRRQATKAFKRPIRQRPGFPSRQLSRFAERSGMAQKNLAVFVAATYPFPSALIISSNVTAVPSSAVSFRSVTPARSLQQNNRIQIPLLTIDSSYPAIPQIRCSRNHGSSHFRPFVIPCEGKNAYRTHPTRKLAIPR